MRLFRIPLGLPFLPTLARGVMQRLGGEADALPRSLILLPTQRSARAAHRAFLDASEKEALLLPQLRALAGLSVEDADELQLPALLELPPAVEALRRQAVLARFVARWPRHAGGPPTARHAWELAGELARLLDEIALEEAEPIPDDPARLTDAWLARLEDLAPEKLATHWQITTTFLRGVVGEWQGWLDAEGLLDIGVRRVLALKAQRTAWEDDPPETPVIAAGIGLGGTVPAAADLLRVVATRLPRGFVVLAGEDPATARVPDEHLLDSCTHPFAGQRRMLRRMGATMADARDWTADQPPRADRPALLGSALLPAEGLRAWMDRRPRRWSEAMAGMTQIEAPDAQAEAAAIALTLRGALERPGARAALVTPDRDLACRVASELPRHGILAEDSAGQRLSATPNGNFLRLVAHLAAGECGPVSLLSVMKHPLAACGWERPDWLAAVRRLEVAVLRGPSPGPGFRGLRAGIAAAFAGDRADLDRMALLERLVSSLETALGPFHSLPRTAPLRPALDLFDEHLAAAERLAETPSRPGGLRLYAHAEGEALARHLTLLRPAMAEMPPVQPAEWPALFEAALSLGTTACPRVSRGRREQAHPHVEILGLLEARLLDFDCVVLGALDETVWPLAADPGPWMSRPMRRDFGLPPPELRIGRVAADFLSVACSGREVTLSRAARRGGSPTVPARWLTRLSTFLRGQRPGLGVPLSAAPAWAEALDRSAEPPRPCTRPAIAPPAEARPSRVTVSDVRTLLADPYAFYAQRILRLRALAPLEQEPGSADYGTLVHSAIHRFLDALPPAWPGEAAARRLWDAAQDEAIARAHLRPAVEALWRPRLGRIGGFVRGLEASLRPGLAEAHAEAEAKLTLRRPAGAVALEARADRLDVLKDGAIRIVDFKTGQPPSQKAVREGSEPQLPLEGLLAEAGAFEGIRPGPVRELEYWQLSGALEPGKVRPLGAELESLLEEARRSVEGLADRFLLGSAPFLSRPHPARPARGDYAHLARIAEWSSGAAG
ncbi:double-strand break repair protein AddB [Sabulicella glaciei]|uniref:Double-strand break repair protein AddB n=1 Tax=Sabulicella glaciei TaxID=2984948 RepID=A0ABT3NY47_9PROT|nr:double-strand break repair protein AddB [Roseococcus sp. MDT2-1-1]MCW8087085.1 double-strand break repair protein AddB [Roseococcus sp. MDT2-1-1]